MSSIENRYEILFLYEAKDCNPNGDPLDENRPRTDPETGVATVTDVRIKRTVRDFFLAIEPDVEKRIEGGTEILIRDTFKQDGFLSQGKDRAENFIDEAIKGKKGLEKLQALQDAIMKGCIDARLFGCALPMGKNEPSLKVTGPVQFMPFNRSLHRVAPQMVQQTAAFAGSATASQKSFAERWLLPYALIAAYGVVNENAARTTGMSPKDLNRLLDALWRGTAELNTHSKMGHDPMLLLVVESQAGHKIGALQRRVKMTDQPEEETAIRDSSQFCIDLSELLDAIAQNDKVVSTKARQSTRLRVKDGVHEAGVIDLLKERSLAVESLEI
ncbi:type I-B CRISPR-associated protein Cas7/Csh2 [Desulfoferrobacter suflitae]|uniref:type I-B CRISPR-associated protein Cas7/Csh2 n=1 Tax=Desulfoferrobacter suflitae TaxID=2865782 RepID=UPI0021641215|nr:type I-B CRISPR-associated protein Cas7/Csh2 [Desulfoferrobacter suflitae]MCK8603806.1 type I-B CRISPR-associated protein Cas7/Csh2 [Desulfoferrobacter suflitae]